MDLYFVAILPPLEIEAQIKSFKLEMKERYNCRNALKLPAHITLQIPFKMTTKKENALKEALAKTAKNHNAFEINLDGFDCFPSRVIFIRIPNHQQIVMLHKIISATVLKYIPIKETDRKVSIHPHINIASRDLKEEDFPEAWREFQNRTYSAKFTADHFCLFRHNGKTWDLCDQFFLVI